MARKILLADDSVTAQNMGRKILADAGYEVITVNNGSAALKKIAEQKPDLIVLDVYMPGYSGLEVCQRLKEAQDTSRVPVLLTVGKLEPFKPEEARRVRADGFIVKPFEASELLSALSKLEDKIVPRSESKPGRFARANAAMDEGRYDKTVAVDEDSGWKNRIVFPKKKTEVAPEESDDSTIYNAMNKDLRTVVERKAAEPYEAKAEEARVDLGALAFEGLPKDVTPEEIAALAAAAAQVKGKIVEAAIGQEKIAEEKIAESRFVEPPVASRMEPPVPEPTQTASSIPPAVAVATFAGERPEEKIEAKVEEKTEAKIEDQVEKTVEAKIEAAVGKSSETRAHADLMAAIATLEPETPTSPGASSGTPSSARPDSGNAGSGNTGSGNGSGGGSWLQGAADRTDEPVTMAIAAGTAESIAPASRWTAVAVTLAPEEAAISLEHEMQKAHAAFAAAESGHARADATMPEIQPPPPQTPHAEISQSQIPPNPTAAAQSVTALETSFPAETAPAPSAPMETPALEPAVTVPSTPVQEVEQALSTAASVATDAISAAVQELEAVAAAYAEQMKPVAAHEPAPVKDFVIAAPLAPETRQSVAGSVSAGIPVSLEQIPVVAPVAPAPEIPQVESAKPDALQNAHEGSNLRREELSQQEIEEPEIEKARIEELEIEEPKIEAVKTEGVKSEVPAPVVAAAPVAEAASTTVTETPETTTATVNQVPAPPSSDGPVSPVVISSEIGSAKFSAASIFSSDVVSSGIISSDMAAVAPGEPTAGGISDMAKKESEIAANTAAAWANWRRIRETDPKAAAPSSADPSEKEVSSPQDAAAMAVAAGAEKAPEDAHAATGSDSDDIAGIVDSVLADLRPKIVEEISRKMGKKK